MEDKNYLREKFRNVLENKDEAYKFLTDPALQEELNKLDFNYGAILKALNLSDRSMQLDPHAREDAKNAHLQNKKNLIEKYLNGNKESDKDDPNSLRSKLHKAINSIDPGKLQDNLAQNNHFPSIQEFPAPSSGKDMNDSKPEYPPAKDPVLGEKGIIKDRYNYSAKETDGPER